MLPRPRHRAFGLARGARFKDYVSTPKQNNYQSIHTTVVGPRHQWVELQIRTDRMHQIAEYGVAAHALYKDGIKLSDYSGNGSAAAEGEPLQLVAAPGGHPARGDSPKFRSTPLDCFRIRSCFTPKGRLIALPRDATPIDFAYAVHTDVGNSCVGAVINGRQLPLDDTLRNGDQVEILTAKADPPAAWSASPSPARRAPPFAGPRAGAAAGYSSSAIGCSCPPFAASARTTPTISSRKVWDADAKIGRRGACQRRSRRAAGKGCDPRHRADQAHPRPPCASTGAANGQTEKGWFNPRQGDRPQVSLAGYSGGRLVRTQVLPIRGLKNDVPVEFEEGGAVPGDRIVGVLSDGEGIHARSIPPSSRYEHALDRRDVGHRPRQSRAVPGQDRRHRPQ